MSNSGENGGPDEPHIVSRFDAELSSLKKLIADMGDLALKQVREAITGLAARDIPAARIVVQRDRDLNYMHMDVKEKVITLFAIRQPVAGDLRLVVSLSSIGDAIEHVGDEAKRIARSTIRLCEGDRIPPVPELLRDATHMGALAPRMLEDSLLALKNRNVEEAVAVLKHDKELDAEFRSALRKLATFILEDPRNLKHAIEMVFVLKGLERIGDYAKNVSEQLIYIVKGEDVRYMNVDNLANGYLDR
jgi:phosphate transport system protein